MNKTRNWRLIKSEPGIRLRIAKKMGPAKLLLLKMMHYQYQQIRSEKETRIRIGKEMVPVKTDH